MTTASWSAVLNHRTDAEFRAWGRDYSDHLAAVGLVRTADTGQINWDTVLRPGAINTAAGYEIWRFADALQATAPIFIKIEYGTFNVLDRPAIWITVGKGSDGSGTITGIDVVRVQCNGGNGNTPDTAYPSYFCHVAGHLAVAFRVGAWSPSSSLCFIINRYSNDDGTPNGDGYVLHVNNNSTSAITFARAYSVRFSAPAGAFPIDASTGRYAMFPMGSETDTSVETGEFQVAPFVHKTPRFQVAFGMCGVLKNELPEGSTAQFALKGSTLRTFIGAGDAFGFGGAGPSNGRHAMLWE